jgi:excisionase family DNA binding protein
MSSVGRSKTRLRWLEVVSARLEDGCLLEGKTPEQLLAETFAPKATVRPTTDETRASSSFMTVKEIANDIHLHEKVIRRAIEAGELPATKVRERIRVRRSDYQAWLEANKVEPYPVPELEP